MGGGDCTRCLRAADRVTGPKYPSSLLVSEGVGEGDITRGVCGIWYWREEAMAFCQQRGNEGSGGHRMSPVRDRRACAQKYAP